MYVAQLTLGGHAVYSVTGMLFPLLYGLCLLLFPLINGIINDIFGLYVATSMLPSSFW